ncbi:MAG: hypothetical protein GXW96_12775 [Christensenellaceae bacterium]|nr:hypothetical protein [Christensenellaceae bacterium]
MGYIVRSPVRHYSGVTAGVQFSGGIGRTDDPHIADWMRSKGYEVSEDAPPEPPKEPKGKGGKTKEAGEK